LKTLLLIRHAKSSWGDPSISDFDRPLNERGKHDAPLIAQRIMDKGTHIDAFVSSPAKRAKKTAGLMMKKFDEEEKKLIQLSALYEASESNFYDVIKTLDDKFDSVALVAHNPGITNFINTLNCHPIDNMPTCAVYAIRINCDKWIDFKKSKKQFLFFDFPKNEI
jgi:phosphohistidine phosphatase